MSAEVARKLLMEHCTSAFLRKQLAAGLAHDDRIWRELSEISLVGMLMPESAGGLALSEVDFVLVAEACGYAALPGPFVEHAGVAGPLLAAAGAAAVGGAAANAVGTGLAAARADTIVARLAAARANTAVAGLAARAAAGEALLAIGHPANPFVADADTAEAVLLEHKGEVHLVSRRAVRLTREESIDPFRRLFRIDWTASPDTRLTNGALGRSLWEEAFERGALFAAAQCLGLAQRAVDLGVEYVKSRKQFGKPIGSYQAVKHLLASVQVKIEFARPVLYAAAARFSQHDCFSRALISHAKVVASEAAEVGARAALQVHGAMGYSWEVDVHLFLKRALALECAWGLSSFHRKRITRRILTQPLGPEHTFSREQHHA